MPFWKKSEDPWDRKPDKRPSKLRESQEGFVENLKTWNESRKAATKEKEDSKRLPPEKCPWCGKDMEQGYLAAGRGAVWYPGYLTTKAALIGRRDVQGLNVLDEGDFLPYKTTWRCQDCKKMIFNAPDPPKVYDPLTPQGEPGEEPESGAG